MSRYTVYVIPSAWQEIKNLPGHMRQRIKQAVDALASDPRSSQGKKLDVPEADYELWRVRLDRWRIVYAVTEADRTVDVLAIRKRPPYDYGDLDELQQQL